MCHALRDLKMPGARSGASHRFDTAADHRPPRAAWNLARAVREVERELRFRFAMARSNGG
jgi:hypothetical protein